jgi:kynurenine formamidase
LDAPAYLFGRGKGVADFGLERFILDAVLLDLTSKTPGQPVEDEDLEGAEEAAGLALREGEAVILFARADESIPQQQEVFLSQNGAEYLEFKGVSMVGIDSASIDAQGPSDLTAHKILLSNEILVLEDLRNLGGVDSSRFKLCALPLRVSGATAPVRAVAMLDDSC